MTPFVVALLWVLVIVDWDDGFVEDFGAAIILCYVAWLMAGLPLALLEQPKKSPSIWKYIGWGLFLGILPFLLIPAVDDSGWRLLAGQGAVIGAAAGLWYWCCAYWRSPSSETPAQTNN